MKVKLGTDGAGGIYEYTYDAYGNVLTEKMGGNHDGYYDWYSTTTYTWKAITIG